MKFTTFILLLLLIHVVVGSENKKMSNNEFYCNEMKLKYDIIPGESFGTLPFKLHSEYLNAKCYRFFCEPHEMAGKGKFPCVPLIK